MKITKKLLGFAASAGLSGLAVASVTAVAFNGGGSEASSHREAPAISADPLADTTDVYAFIAPDAPTTLTLVGNWIPLEEPAGGPNFYNFGDDVSYEFAIDNNGDAKEDVTYEYRFKTEVLDPTTFLYATGPITSLNDPNFNIRQFYDIYRNGVKIASHLASPPNNIGPVSTPGYASVASTAVHTLADGSKHFAGQRDDPFFVDLGAVFDLATIRVLPGNNGGGIDGVGGFNTHSIVLQVPLSSVTSCACDPAAESPAAVLGVWSDTYRSKTRILKSNGEVKNEGPKVQVSRLGNPLVNEVVIPLSHKDRFNASEPKDDGQFASFVVNSDLAGKLNAVYGLGLPTTGRQDLVTVFLTGIPGLNQPPNVVPSEQIRINVGIKPASAGCANYSPLGVIAGDNCGFPNGRRLADDSTDVELRAVACGYGFDFGPCDSEAAYAATTEQLGDGVDGNDVPFLTGFPYVGTPHDGFDHEHHTGSVIVPVTAGLGGAAGALVLLVVGSMVFGYVRRTRNVAETAA